MSSAILYLAIVVIWACVLIPRWLRRDTPRAATTEETTPDGVLAVEEDATDADDVRADDDDDDARPADSVSPEAAVGHVPAPPQESRRRVLAARRRLLWMMLGLELAGIGLAVVGLAPWWVIAPPTVMLAGYLLLLREAARADREAELREHEAREAQLAAKARARERGGRAHAARPAPAASAPPATWQGRGAGEHMATATYAAAPVEADYADLGQGRDFTPGLRYASSSDASSSDASSSDDSQESDAYDQFRHKRLRAVGD